MTMNIKEEVVQETCSKCKYFVKEVRVCVVAPPLIVYHDVIRIRDEAGKVIETRPPNIVNINPSVHEDRHACRFYNER